MTPLALLTAAAALHAEGPERWCRGAFARRAGGKPIGPQTEDAIQWCMSGACIKAEGLASPDAIRKVGEILSKVVGRDSIPEANDAPSTTYADVMRWWGEAIEVARREEANNA
jgi:hypothetical protein